MASTDPISKRIARVARTVAAALLLLFAGQAAFASTTVFVQNNTPFAFTVSVAQTGAGLAPSSWQRGVATIAAGRRDAVLQFNRDGGVTSGGRFDFVTTLSKDGSSLQLMQELQGATVNSHMWQSLAGTGITDSWHDDRSTHSAIWQVGGMALHLMYRAYFTGTDDNIEYVLQYAYPIDAGDANTFNVLAYNLYLRPTTVFRNGQAIRAQLLPPQLHGYDALVFSEAFDDGVRAQLLAGLRAEYPYATSVVGSDRGVEQDGGMIIVSRWPIEAQDERLYESVCEGSDCNADKGVKYARINRDGHIYHLFGSHTQAWDKPEDHAVRAQQFALIKAFIDSKSIPPAEPVLIAGDLNVDKLAFPDELAQMLRTLNAQLPPQSGHWASWDPTTNMLGEQGVAPQYLDYVLWSKDHRAPSESGNEVRIVRSAQEWKEYGFETALWDLSDHYPVMGHFRFSQLIGQFPTATYQKVFLYGVRPDGTLTWYADLIGTDSAAPPDATPIPPVQRAVMTPGIGVLNEPANTPAVPPSAVSPVRKARIGGAGRFSTGAMSSDRLKVAAVPFNPETWTPAPHKITHQWEGPKSIGTGWALFKDVIPAGAASFYGITMDGVLKWYRHDGFLDGTPRWKGPVDVGSGWNVFTKVIAMGDGVLYGIGADGSLRWYRHGDVADAVAPPHWSGPVAVGSGWGNFLHVFSTGEGVIYAVAQDGKVYWYRHKGYLTGTPEWEGPRQVTTGWQSYARVFSPGAGMIYAVEPSGGLLWFQHVGYRTGTPAWQVPMRIGAGWQDFRTLFPSMWGTPTSTSVH